MYLCKDVERLPKLLFHVYSNMKAIWLVTWLNWDAFCRGPEFGVGYEML